jgi:hypothetical protein
MIRSVGAVIAGYALFALSAVLLFGVSGVPPETWPGIRFVVLAIVYGSAFAALAGFVTATLAPRAPLRHAVVVAVLLAAGAVVFAPPVGNSVTVVTDIRARRFPAIGDRRRVSSPQADGSAASSNPHVGDERQVI